MQRHAGRIRPRQLLQGVADETIHIALVIGQQNPGLEAPPMRAGVMSQPLERKIRPHGIEERQRPRLLGIEGPETVRHLIPDGGQSRCRKNRASSST